MGDVARPSRCIRTTCTPRARSSTRSRRCSRRWGRPTRRGRNLPPSTRCLKDTWASACALGGRGSRTPATAQIPLPDPTFTSALAWQVRVPWRLRGSGEHGRRGPAADAETDERAAVPAGAGPGSAPHGGQPACTVRPLLRAVPGGEREGPRGSGAAGCCALGPA